MNCTTQTLNLNSLLLARNHTLLPDAHMWYPPLLLGVYDAPEGLYTALLVKHMIRLWSPWGHSLCASLTNCYGEKT